MIDKICRRDLDEKLLISDLTSMHDFAGCRLIFDTLSDLEEFREHIDSNSTMRNVNHELRHDVDKYDYIQRPKPSGYRGIHDVYRHYPRGHKRGEDDKKPWDGLAVEIQYRTRAQHAWATAVEISDLLDNERTKFSMISTPRGDFFAIASEIIARNHKNKANALQQHSLSQLESKLSIIEESEGILRRLHVMRRFEYDNRLKRHNVLNIYVDERGELSLEVFGFDSPSEAISLANELEQC